MDQLNLFDTPAVQIDEKHWEIFDGNRLVGTFELDEIGFEFKSCIGPICGGGGPLDAGEDITDSLNHAVVTLQRHYRITRGMEVGT
ncbi:hypothetical protein [Trichococcus collinsii]|uniref:Uncharacterized protein n=1 Tax=Trichococcus collinsii TaxID=157076 RepID=A0AB38A408_9LACT|nr:hypothetical protein [Trichococcus collinsii]CZR10900.1 Hypothetical protein Tcol_3117 [Trichococcus collinsii]SEA96183.1 hypothetical protein SAMN04488525_11337 [Trichococcus collinsii]